jgi:zinc protease
MSLEGWKVRNNWAQFAICKSPRPALRGPVDRGTVAFSRPMSGVQGQTQDPGRNDWILRRAPLGPRTSELHRHMRKQNLPRPIVAALVGIAAALAPAAAQQQQGGNRRGSDPIRIPYERYTLANGLTVILAQNRATPTVTVDLWYHVGSKNEAAGRSGFAHLFEHVMFTGSGNVPYGTHDRMTEGVGGNNNGSTSHDRTNYFENIPSNYLETALWMEADRMGFLLDALDSAKFLAQRDIVQNERRQGVDNQPYGRANEIMLAAMYPAGHPYSWDVIGSMNDLLVAPLEDVKSFFRQYYAPNNATMAIVGDFDPVQTKQWVARYFADIPRGKPIDRPNAQPVTLAGERRLLYEDRVQVPRLYLRWPTVGLKQDDRFPLQVLASICSALPSSTSTSTASRSSSSATVQ